MKCHKSAKKNQITCQSKKMVKFDKKKKLKFVNLAKAKKN